MKKFDQKAAMAKAAEKLRNQKIEEVKKEAEHYETITSNGGWTYFKIGMVFCLLFLIAITVDTFVVGDKVKIENQEWEIDHEWRSSTHAIVKVGGAQFMVWYQDWAGFIPNSFEVTRSPILRDEQILWFMQDPYTYGDEVKEPELKFGTRTRSVFNWFPYIQLALMIPLFTFLFKRPQQWFVFSRMLSMFLIIPGTLLMLFWVLM